MSRARLLAIPGSVRADSTNVALLRAMEAVVAPDVFMEVYRELGRLPIFSPDREGEATPAAVGAFGGRGHDTVRVAGEPAPDPGIRARVRGRRARGTCGHAR